MEIKLKLTIPQAKWLYHILTRAFDSSFENNPRERKLCDNIANKLNVGLDEKGIVDNFALRKTPKK